MAVADAELVAAAKLARRITTDAFDSQVEFLLNAALFDLGVAGIVIPNEIDVLVRQAAITYFLMHFGEPDNYKELRESYWEQKAQLSTHTGHTIWSGE